MRVEASMEESVRIPAGPLHLEGRLQVCAGATRAAVLCHPHPQYGGDMANNVVTACASALANAGCSTLRFNFRGVGASQGSYDDGRGESDDARAAIDFVRAQSGAAHILVVGYSFGAVIGLRAGIAHDAVDRIAAIALPVRVMSIDFAAGCAKPVLIVAGDRDSFCPPDALAVETRRLLSARLVCVQGSDHFFFGDEANVASAVVSFATGGSS